MDQKTIENICHISMEFGKLAGEKKLKLPDDYSAADYLAYHVREWSAEFEQSFSPDDEYLEEIMAFAHKKFRECGWFPVKRTRILYLYRDADNYKVHNSCVIDGFLTTEQMTRIRECCQDGEYFIPEAVGLPEERFAAYTEDDHPFFELLGFEDTAKQADFSVDPEELVEAFGRCKDKWDALGFCS